MFAASELSHAVRARRSDMGLTQTALSKLSGLSRATVNQLENGTLRDLSLTRTARLLNVLGLALTVTPARPKMGSAGQKKTPPLTLAARAASVSYKESLPPAVLGRVLLRGDVPPSFVPHVNALLEDASVELLAAVVEQLHESSGVERAEVWSKMRSIARQLDVRRDIWQ